MTTRTTLTTRKDLIEAMHRTIDCAIRNNDTFTHMHDQIKDHWQKIRTHISAWYRELVDTVQKTDAMSLEELIEVLRGLYQSTVQFRQSMLALRRVRLDKEEIKEWYAQEINVFDR